MGRPRTCLQLSPTDQTALTRRLVVERDARVRERLQFAERAATGRYTLEELAVFIGRSRSTLQNWLDKFTAGGLTGLLEREAPPGRTSPLADHKVQTQLDAALKSGRLRTAAQVAAWLHDKHGCRRARKSMYYWLRRRDGQGVSRRRRQSKPGR